MKRALDRPLGLAAFGLLFLSAAIPGAFAEDEVPIFQSLADNIAVAIDNATDGRHKTRQEVVAHGVANVVAEFRPSIVELSTSLDSFLRGRIRDQMFANEAARLAGVRRFVLMSALGTSETAKDTVPYFASKWAMEQETVRSGLEYTIFRPSFVFGLSFASFQCAIQPGRRPMAAMYTTSSTRRSSASAAAVSTAS